MCNLICYSGFCIRITNSVEKKNLHLPFLFIEDDDLIFSIRGLRGMYMLFLIFWPRFLRLTTN